MTKAEEKRREKARQLRYRKPVVLEFHWDGIKTQLTEIEEECAEVHWYCDSEDGWDTLLNAMDGDSDDAGEFKIAFAELEGECELMRMEMDQVADWDAALEDHFDTFFAGIGADRVGGGMLGFDTYEGDYYGLEPGWESRKAEEHAAEQLKRLTKDQLIRLMGQAFRVAVQFLALRSRYFDLKAAMDILREQNTSLLKQVREIEELYDKAEAEGFSRYDYLRKDSEKALDRLLANLPDRAWIE